MVPSGANFGPAYFLAFFVIKKLLKYLICLQIFTIETLIELVFPKWAKIRTTSISSKLSAYFWQVQLPYSVAWLTSPSNTHFMGNVVHFFVGTP